MVTTQYLGHCWQDDGDWRNIIRQTVPYYVMQQWMDEGTCNVTQQAMVCLALLLPLPSSRQHLSYDVCLEVRGEIIRTVLCCIVY